MAIEEDLFSMPAFETREWYDEPKAYDIVYDVDSEKEADFLEAVMDRYVRSSKTAVLEPACGSGRLVAQLAERGFRVWGFDLNPNMLAFAEQRLSKRSLSAELRCMDLSDFSFGAVRFDLAHCLVSSFRHVSDGENAARHLARVADALRPGGVYALGLLLTDYTDRQKTYERFEVERHGVRVQCHHTTFPANRRRRTATMRARMSVTEGHDRKKFESSWTSRTYGPRQLAALIASEPRFEIVGCHDFDYDVETQSRLGDDRLDKVVILRKRARARTGKPQR